MKEMDIKPQEAQRIAKTRDSKRPTPRHIIIKMPKVKYKERLNTKRKTDCFSKNLSENTHKTGS